MASVTATTRRLRMCGAVFSKGRSIVLLGVVMMMVATGVYIHTHPAPNVDTMAVYTPSPTHPSRTPMALAPYSADRASRDHDVATTKKTLLPSRKKIVYFCEGVCGGWADRQKGIVGAYVLAAMLDRDFRVHISFPCDLGLFMAPNKVDWRVNAAELSGQNVKKYITQDQDSVNFALQLVQTEDLRQKLSDDVTVLTWNMEVVKYLRQHELASRVGWMAGKTVPEIFSQALRDIFTLSHDVQDALNTFHKSVPADTKLICAQMRLGNRPGFPDAVLSYMHTVQQFPVLVNFLSTYNHSKNYRIFVASDSDEIVSMAKREFPEVILSIPGPITHIDNTRGLTACDGFKKAILDEYALSECDVLIISESGLGKVASFLRGSDRELYLFHDDKIERFTMDGVFPNKDGW
ncbi:uncharacterized protein [Littorina saxatilis]|uniref:uncharacterized protein n=1 Tax=Littorina saxatilis TaxID=31220 RepID=UPI0038B66BCF